MDLSKIDSAIKVAMKARDTKNLGVLRYLRSQIKNKEIELRPEKLKSAHILQVIRKMIRSSEDALEKFQQAERMELVENAKNEISILKKFLPKELNEVELEKIVKDTISELSASSMKDMGKVIKQVMEKTGGSADPKKTSFFDKAKHWVADMQTLDLKEQVRAANDLASLVSEFTTLKKAGIRLKGLCPLPGHSEKTPSFTVSEDLQLYYCYGCRRGGDVFSFISQVKSLNFRESLEFLANKAGIKIDRSNYVDKTYLKLLKINSLACEYFKKSLKSLSENHGAKIYLKKRGVLDVAEEFGLGFAKDNWQGLLDHLKGEDIKLLESLGLIRKNKTGGYYDLFRNRIIFPIEDSKGVLGFGGRTISEDDNVKYLNSPESKLFQKGTILYGINKAVGFIRSSDMAILVEGYMDVISMHRQGFKNTVGVMGTGLTDHQALLLRKYTKNVVLLFDSDEAGLTAAKRSLGVLLNAGLYPKILKLPFKDPDETLKKKGAKWLKENLGQSEDLFRWVLIDKMKQDNKVLTIYDREHIFDELRKLKKFVNDENLMYSFDKMFEQILEIPKHVVENKGFQSKFKHHHFTKVEQKEQSSPKHELVLAGVLLLKPEYAKKLGEVEEMLSCKNITHIVKKVQNLSGHEEFSADSLVHGLEDRPDGLLECMMGLEALDAGKVGELFRDSLFKIKARFLKQRSKLVLNDLNYDNRTQKLKEFSRLQVERHGLSKAD